MSQGASSGRLRELESLRGIAIASVVAIHVSWDYAVAAGLERSAGRLAAAVHLTAGFAVPLFLTLSAVGLSLGYSGRMSPREYRDFLGRRALRLLPAYVLWSLASMAVLQPHLLGSPLAVARVLLRGTADAQFYYIPLVFELYLLWPVFQPLVHASKRSGAAAVAIAIAGFAVSAWWWSFTMWRPQLQGTAFLIVIWLLYVFLGIAIAPHLSTLRTASRRVLVAQAMATSVAGCLMYENFITQAERQSFRGLGLYFAAMIFQLPSTAYIYCAISTTAVLAFRYRDALASFFTPLARHSYGIYLIHYLVLRVIVYRVVPPGSLAEASTAAVGATVALGWLACVAISTALVAIASRFAMTRPLVGSHG